MDLDDRAEPSPHTEVADLVVPESFESFYRRERAGAIALSYALCGNRAIAEELVQDAMTAVAARWESVARLDSPVGWLRRVVSNRSVSHLRRAATETRMLAKLQSHRQRTIELPNDDAQIWALVRRLPRRQAQVIALKSLFGLSLSEIGEVLGISKETAQTHADRARSTLATYLREDR